MRVVPLTLDIIQSFKTLFFIKTGQIIDANNAAHGGAISTMAKSGR